MTSNVRNKKVNNTCQTGKNLMFRMNLWAKSKNKTRWKVKYR